MRMVLRNLESVRAVGQASRLPPRASRPRTTERGLSSLQQAPNADEPRLRARSWNSSNIAADWKVSAPVCAVVRLSITVSLLFLLLPFARSQSLTINTLAGNAGQDSADGSGSGARFNSPAGVAVDGSGNLYVADTANHTIRKITSCGAVSTL